ncbi:translation elongation factor Ts [Proteiniclasticum ruminis]|uniref:translation elongation factor Ts n=1 Tax=Proteiniclasticum ruminis TaxID=398199 RepID=UPI001B5628F2|nr:translation elongation factor Ts [Proteiniclasticum ruminis]MBP9920358.1 elongation factor Ts [Proteiniclasticum sp.]
MISAQAVKELRDKTGAGMMDCKKALTQAEGDLEKAVDILREKGLASAAKKSGRVAAEGVIATYVSDDLKNASIIELNCETDFVSANEAFIALANDIAKAVAESNVDSLEAVKALPYGDATIQDAITALIAKLGENMNLRRYEKMEAPAGLVSSYIHMGGKIGVLVQVDAENASQEVASVAKDVAMHVAALNPQFLDNSSVDADTIEREREIYRVQALNEGKPEKIVDKMVDGRINKFFKEVCLVNQMFVKNPDLSIEAFVKEESKKLGNIKLVKFVRFEKGEGIEKEEVDFAAEVAAQMGQNK